MGHAILKIMDLVIVITAKYVVFLSILIAGIYFLLVKNAVKKKLAILAIISLPLTYIIAKITSHFIYDPRPFVVDHIKPLIEHSADNGFPSDHTLITMAIASVVFAYNKKVGGVLFIIALLVGSSRVLAHVHHPLDIAGSTVIAICVTAAVYLLLSRLRKNPKQTHEDN